MNKNIKYGIVGLSLLTLGATSCKKFLNVNTNPNVTQTATVQTLLPAGELYLGSSVGVDLQIDGGFWAQYWTQSAGASQYRNLDMYDPYQDVFSTPWSNLYSAAENFYQMYKLADSQKHKNYMAISLLMRAYTFQVITDGWGDAPFKQALFGQYADSNITNPKYDSQKVIYNGILAEIDSANALIAEGDAFTPGTDDLIYGGSMIKWQRFSNTLKLKVLLRMSQIDPLRAQDSIAALYASGATFIGAGDDAFISYGSSSTNRNPLYAEEVGLFNVQNLVGSSTCIDSLNSNNDPRIGVFYEQAAALETPTNPVVYAGIPQGQFNGSYNSGTFSIPSTYVAGDAGSGNSANAPVNFMTSYESLFLQAEVSARKWANAGQDSTLFAQAIQASFNYYANAISAVDGIPAGTAYNNYMAGGGYWTKYPTGSSTAALVRYIITQKWFAMCGNQGFEAWTEWRRTGYPDFLVISATSQIGNNFPKRFLYPTSESTVNSNYPGLAPLTSKVWWDVL
jgi:Starch-binding associating with outer membrane